MSFGEFNFQKHVTDQLFGWEICEVQLESFYRRQDYEEIDFYKKWDLYIIGWTLDCGDTRITTGLKLARNWNSWSKICQKYFLYHHSQPLYDVMQRKIEVLEFVQSVNFEIIHSLKHNSTKYLLVFDDSCEETCNSKAFVDIAFAWRHRGLSTVYIKHNWFHQIKLWRGVELQNTQIVPFKSHRDVMQVSTFSPHLGLESE